jgi:hypothetical protein
VDDCIPGLTGGIDEAGILISATGVPGSMAARVDD